MEPDSGSFDPEADKIAMLATWKHEALSPKAADQKKKANSFVRQNGELEKPLRQESSSEKKTKKPRVKKSKEDEEKVKTNSANRPLLLKCPKDFCRGLYAVVNNLLYCGTPISRTPILRRPLYNKQYYSAHVTVCQMYGKDRTPIITNTFCQSLGTLLH